MLGKAGPIYKLPGKIVYIGSDRMLGALTAFVQDVIMFTCAQDYSGNFDENGSERKGRNTY